MSNNSPSKDQINYTIRNILDSYHQRLVSKTHMKSFSEEQEKSESLKKILEEMYSTFPDFKFAVDTLAETNTAMHTICKSVNETMDFRSARVNHGHVTKLRPYNGKTAEGIIETIPKKLIESYNEGKVERNVYPEIMSILQSKSENEEDIELRNKIEELKKIVMQYHYANGRSVYDIDILIDKLKHIGVETEMLEDLKDTLRANGIQYDSLKLTELNQYM